MSIIHKVEKRIAAMNMGIIDLDVSRHLHGSIINTLNSSKNICCIFVSYAVQIGVRSLMCLVPVYIFHIFT